MIKHRYHIRQFLAITAPFFLLAACQPQASPDSTPSAPTSSVSMPSPSTTQVTSDSAPSLSFPRVDSLSPYSPPAAAPRKYSDPVLAFVPADDYEKVYPYLGQRNANAYGQVSNGLSNVTFGFADSVGEIICDPVYDGVSVVRNGDAFVYVVTQHYFPADVDQTDMNNQVTTTAVIGSDGKFCGTYDAVYTNSVYNFEYEYIPVEKDGKWGAIDFNGGEALPCVYANPPLFSGGMAAMFNDDGTTYRYINSKGDTVLAGPFEQPTRVSRIYSGGYGSDYDANLEAAVFHNEPGLGFLAMSFKDEHYGYINESGTLVIPRMFTLMNDSQIGWNAKGLAMACVTDVTPDEFATSWPNPGDLTYELIDATGAPLVQYVVSGYNGQFYLDNSGKYYIGSVYSGGNASMTVFNLDGSTVPGDGQYFNNGYWTIQNDDGSWQITGNGVSRELNYSSVYWTFGDIFSIYDNPNGDYSVTKSWLYNARTGENVLGGRDISKAFWNDPPEQTVCYGYKNADGDDYTQLFGMLDGSGNVVLDFSFDVLQRVDPSIDKFFAAQGNYGGLLNADGTWFIKVLLDGNYD